MPVSSALLWATAIAYVLINVCLAGAFMSPGGAIGSAILTTLVLAGVTRLVLWVRELDARMVQTLTALLGTGIVFGFLLVPLIWVLFSYENPAQRPMVISLIVPVLFIWNLGVVAHILRHAMNVPFIVGIGIAILYFYIIDSVSRAFFPIPIV